MAAEQAFGEAIGVDDDVAAAARDDVDRFEHPLAGRQCGARARMLSMVGVTLVLRTAVVFSGDAVFRCLGFATPIRSKPRIKSALPALVRAGASTGCAAQQHVRDDRSALLRRAGLIERRTYRPSIQAAVASRALIVTTPVPPMPGHTMR